MSFKVLKSNCVNQYFVNVDDYLFQRNGSDKTTNNLKILQFNIWGMNDLIKFDKLLLFVESLQSDVHILVVTETFVQSSNKFSFNINNYISVFSCRDDRTGGGIAMFIRNDIPYIVEAVDDGSYPFQYICIKLPQINSTKVCGIYRPPNTDTKYFLEFLEQFLTNYKSSSDFIIVGDINIPVNKTCDITAEYNSTLLSHGMIVTNTFVTRPLSNNILDHAVSSFLNIEQVFNSTIEANISDHSFVFSNFCFKSKYSTRKLVKRSVNYKKVNLLFGEFLASATFNTQNPEATLQLIFEKYNELCNKFSILKEVSIKIKNTSVCPWMTLDLWELIKMKNRILKRYRLLNNNSELKNKLEVLNKKIKSGKYFAKKLYFKNLFNNLNQKEVWKQINNFMSNKSSNTIQSIIYNEVDHKELGCIVNLFNCHFVNANNYSISPNSSSTGSDDLNKFKTIVPCTNSLFLRPTSTNEISNLILSLNNTKSCGHDNIGNVVVKKNSSVFSLLLAELFNVVLETGRYPDCLKIAKVLPIFKSGNVKSVTDYRPISVLSVFDKILEKIIASRMIEFLNKSNFFYSHQYGFRQGSGTDLALTEITDFIYRSFDSKKYVLGLFLDLRKAFDSIDHSLLLKKLHFYGFRGLAYKLLESYLCNRKQYVVINGVRSCTLDINCGVPQGSVLGPLLFLVYINDIAQLPLNGQIRMFADDTALFYDSKYCDQAMSLMVADFKLLLNFFKLNKISVNFTKTKFIVFHSPHLQHYDLPPFEVSNHTIERVDKFKYLGVILDKHMTWDEHINSICLKVSPFICLIRKLVAYVPVHVLRMIYFSFIHTRFLYAAATFGTAVKTKLHKLQTMQNKCVKAIYRLPHLFSSAELYRTVAKGILPFHAIFEMCVSVYMYKCLNLSSALSNIQFEFINHRYLTRNSSLLKCPQIKTEFGRKSITFIGPYIYNNIPEFIKSANNIYKFKKIIKLHLSSSAEEYL